MSNCSINQFRVRVYSLHLSVDRSERAAQSTYLHHCNGNAGQMNLFSGKKLLRLPVETNKLIPDLVAVPSKWIHSHVNRNRCLFHGPCNPTWCGIFFDRITSAHSCNKTRYRAIALDTVTCNVDNEAVDGYGLTMNNNAYTFNCDKFLYKLEAISGTDESALSMYRLLRQPLQCCAFASHCLTAIDVTQNFGWKIEEN